MNPRLPPARQHLRRLLDRADRRPAVVAASVCGVITVWAVVMHELTSVATEWMPHIAAGAATIALTVTLVDVILRRQAEERLRPWRELVFMKAATALWECLEWIAYDYVQAHISSFKPIPEEALSLLDLWLAEQPNEDTDREGHPRLLIATATLVSVLEGLRASDRDVLPPAFVRAIDDLAEADRVAQVLWIEKGAHRKAAPFESQATAEERYEKRRKDSLECAVGGVRRFTEVLLRTDSRAKMPERIAESATSLHYSLLTSVGD